MLLGKPALIALLERAEKEIGSASDGAPMPAGRDGKLADIWDRARRSVAYRDIGDFSPAAFAALPVTPREALKRRPWDYTVVGLDRVAKYYETTGTSGTVTPTPRTIEDIVWNTVSVATGWGRLVGAGDRVLVLLPSDLVPVADLVVNVCEYRGVPHARAYPFATGITDWDRLIGVFRTFRPTVLFVAPGVAVQLTRLAKQRGLLTELGASCRSLMLLGEVSTPPMRARLGHWWGARCYDASYGSTETGTTAASCTDGSLHLLTAANHVELRTASGVEPLPDGAAVGTLVVTPLNLYARPLLRFDTGDRVTVERGCTCGSAAPVVTVHGRASDGLTLHDAPLTPRAVEEIVYEITTATGYLIEIDPAGRHGRLLLERDVDADRAGEPAQVAAVQRATGERLRIHWDDVIFVNTLSVTTKSGGSQKSWKRSNIRVVEPVA
jgi:phenylacetate-CoA ligase